MLIDPSQTQVLGPLSAFAVGFADELTRQGYRPSVTGNQMRLLAQLSRWLMGEGRGVGALHTTEVERFLLARRTAGYTQLLSIKAMQPILAYLRGLGVAPTPPLPTPSGPVEAALERYRHHLTVERGLAAKTARGYVDAARLFLRARTLPDGLALDLRNLTAADVISFVVGRCPHQGHSAARLTVTALRSLLGFLHVQGEMERPLASAVPSVACRRLVGLPKGLEPDHVRRLLTSCDSSTQNGCRDFAILTMLVRLGLRASEVTKLAIDDIDWRAGEIIVRGKANCTERLPLPGDVGEAVAAYLHRGRPATAHGRTIFVRIKAPHRPLSACGVTQVVAAAARRAGLGRIHAHRLRHTAATQMLRAGASLPEIGQLLRHRRALTTAIYAKVDRDLRQGRPRRSTNDRPPLAGRRPMSALRQALADYLAVRRVLGYKLVRAEKLLAQFLAYVEDRGEDHLTTETALAWAILPAEAHRGWTSTRLSIVRCFAAHLRGIDPATEVPPVDLLPGRNRRATPYLYSEEEMTALIAATEILSTSHRTATYRTLIALLAVTGMRVGEAISLDSNDFDVTNGTLTIRSGKFGKSRELPLHPSTVTALGEYLRRGDRPRPPPKSPALFVSTAGTRLLYTNVRQTFHQLVCQAGLKPRSALCRPRLHDIRHGFAVSTIRDSYRNGGDPGARLALLSTYLGHVDPGKTYWYLSAAPELLQLAGDRLEHHLGGGA